MLMLGSLVLIRATGPCRGFETRWSRLAAATNVLARNLAREQRIRFEKIRASTARDNEVMRKRVLGSDPLLNDPPDGCEWLKLQELAEIEVTSEADGYPTESAFNFGAGLGWRAALPGKQRIRLVFDQPQSIKRVRLRFNEPEVARTQEFSVQWSGGAGDPFNDWPLSSRANYFPA
jgi:hypothetical protein